MAGVNFTYSLCTVLVRIEFEISLFGALNSIGIASLSIDICTYILHLLWNSYCSVDSMILRRYQWIRLRSCWNNLFNPLIKSYEFL